MRAYPLLILPLLCIITAACKKETTGMQHASGYNVIDKILDDSVPVRFNGKGYAVIHVNGREVYNRSYGGYDGNTRQLIASCSKWLSGAVLMSLVDEGKLKLSDTVGKFLPVFTANGKGSITIAQLFSHTSGFPGNSSQGYESNPLLTLEAAVDAIGRNVPLLYPPGKVFYYGGVSMQVAGRICEIVSSKSWKEISADKIFTPCGMTSTDFGLTANPLIAGGARSTPNDYMKFLDMLVNKGVTPNGTRVLSEAAVAAMEGGQISGTTVGYTPYPLAWLNTSDFYGIGNWRDNTGAGDMVIESSSPGAFGSHPWINYPKKTTGIIFTFIAQEGYLTTAPTCLKVRNAVRSIVP
ncbi:CubicO group peptidase, beta-lactamase class C family [Chitinophaga eiseniae]|uniref:CubicO group peptidase, beta-lactamase class C family n=1 Tax=Chitinophaga eiseniae TaxID=634771 RepID=A0A1T4M1J3_9BACT|nr:serine hydrolase domain-containing protein [Chitinophaga eiseniae]SJZ60776.1 CubicO group peptidase, beta-lactamase class C family [Chitinophaga eiseniae]